MVFEVGKHLCLHRLMHLGVLGTDVGFLAEVFGGSGFIVDLVELKGRLVVAASFNSVVFDQLPWALAHGHTHLAVHREVPEDGLALAAVRQDGGFLRAVKVVMDIAAVQLKGGVFLGSSDLHEGGKKVDDRNRCVALRTGRHTGSEHEEGNTHPSLIGVLLTSLEG